MPRICLGVLTLVALCPWVVVGAESAVVSADALNAVPSLGAAAFLAVVLLLLFKLWPTPVDAPTPPGLPFLGNTLDLLKNYDTLPEYMLNMALEKRASTVGLRTIGIGPLSRGIMSVATPENVKHILKDAFDTYEKGPAFRAPLFDFLGNGIFTSDGALWRMHRKVAAGMFTRNLLQLGTEVALAQAEKLRVKIEEHVASGAEFDLQACYFNFTLDVFSSIAFGVELDSQNHTHEFGRAFDFVQRVSNQRFGNPLWQVARALGLGQERECARQIKVMKSFGRRIIASKRREATDDVDSMGPDLISRFLVTAARSGEELTDTELLDIVLNFMIAGRDTTASALSWTTVELLRKPETLAKVHAELQAVLPPPAAAGAGADADADATAFFSAVYNKLPYLKAASSEALRLHPSVMKDGKYALKDDTLPDGTRVRKGQYVAYSPYVLGRHPDLWDEPNEFKPERFCEASDGAGGGGGSGSGGSLYAAAQSVSDYKLPVFNAGPRVCLGRPLAYLEIQLLLAFLLQRYDFKLSRSPNDDYVSSLVSPMKHGLWVTAARR